MLSWRKESVAATPSGRDGGGVRPTAGAPAAATPRKGLIVRSPLAAQSRCRRLGDMLVEEGVITQAHLERALDRQKTEGGFLGHNLVVLEIISERTLISFLVKQCKIPHLSLINYQISPDILGLIPKEVCLRHNLLPIDRLGTILTVAMVDPLNIQALEEVRRACSDLRIKPILCTWEHFSAVCKRVFANPEEREETGQVVSLKGLGFTLPNATQKKESEPRQDRDLAVVKRLSPDVAAREDAPNLRPGAIPGARPKPPLPLEARPLTTAELAAGLRGAVCEVVGALSKQLQEARTEGGVPDPLQDSKPYVEEIAGKLRETFAGLAETLRGPLAGDIAATLRETLETIREKQAETARELAAVCQTLRECAASMTDLLLRAGSKLDTLGTAPENEACMPGVDQLSVLIRSNVAQGIREGLGSFLRSAAESLVREDTRPEP